MLRALCAGLLLAASTTSPTFAASTSPVMQQVSLTVQSSCTLTKTAGTGDFDFGTLNANAITGSIPTATATLNFSCSASAPKLALAETPPTNTTAFTMTGAATPTKIPFNVCLLAFYVSTGSCGGPGNFVNSGTLANAQALSATDTSVALQAYFTVPSPFVVDRYTDIITATLFF